MGTEKLETKSDTTPIKILKAIDLKYISLLFSIIFVTTTGLVGTDYEQPLLNYLSATLKHLFNNPILPPFVVIIWCILNVHALYQMHKSKTAGKSGPFGILALVIATFTFLVVGYILAIRGVKFHQIAACVVVTTIFALLILTSFERWRNGLPSIVSSYDNFKEINKELFGSLSILSVATAASNFIERQEIDLTAPIFAYLAIMITIYLSYHIIILFFKHPIVMGLFTVALALIWFLPHIL
ncbi:hypothetical protein ACUH97_03290 [Dermabacteraceae bacterium P13088]